jgi:hypothetical protein
MTGSQNICIICAWRETCQKKFSVSGKDIRCCDYVEDVSLKKEKEKEETEQQ